MFCCLHHEELGSQSLLRAEGKPQFDLSRHLVERFCGEVQLDLDRIRCDMVNSVTILFEELSREVHDNTLAQS